MKRFLKRRDGVVQRYEIARKNWFKYRKATPHRPRELERKWKRRVRVYEKIDICYRTIIVQNWKGSGRVGERGAWSFTVDASIYTPAPIDSQRFNGLQNLVASLAEWLIDEFGFHGATYDTKGAAVDQPRSAADVRRAGFYVVNLDVEDVTMARGDYRLRRNIDAVNAAMLVESCERGSYSVRDMQVVPWVAPHLRLHRGETV